MQIRPVAWSDFPSFLEFYYSRYEEVRTNPDLFLYTHETKSSEGDEATWFGRLMKGVLDGNVICLVAEDGGTVVGAASVERKPHREDRHTGIYANALLPAWRGRGIGHQLLEATLRACEGKFEVLYLTVTAANERALALYRKHGFEECGRFPRAFKRGDRYLDDLLMWRAIPPAPPAVARE